MTLGRYDPSFSHFLDKLMVRVSQGELVATASSDLCPRTCALGRQILPRQSFSLDGAAFGSDRGLRMPGEAPRPLQLHVSANSHVRAKPLPSVSLESCTA